MFDGTVPVASTVNSIFSDDVLRVYTDYIHIRCLQMHRLVITSTNCFITKKCLPGYDLAPMSLNG